MTEQTAFRAALLDPAASMPVGLTDASGRPAGKRYDVYRNNVTVSLREALAEGFPALRSLLGAPNFDNVARDYLRRFPPSSPLMMFYGEEFPAYLGNVPQLTGLPYLADVARLELAMRRSYHAADATAIDPSTLATLDQDSLMNARLTLAPSAYVLSSPWPVLSVWRYATQPDQPKPQAQAQDVLIARPEFDPEPHLLPRGGAMFLTALARGDSFGSAATQAGDGFDLTATLQTALATQIFTALTTEPSA